jgi:hypothetical protein
MSTNNDVFKTLFLPNKVAVTSGNIADLSEGDWGVFNYETGVAINVASTITLPAGFIIAYKGDGTLGTAGEMYTSAGTHIQTKNFESITLNNDTAGVAQILQLSNVDILEDDDISLKLDLRGNTDVYMRFGANQASKFFTANVKNLGNVGVSEDPNAEGIAQFAEGIANDVDQFLSLSVAGTGITNSPVVYTASGVSGKAGQWSDSVGDITAATALAQIRTYPTSSSDITMDITVGMLSSMYNFCAVNPKYFKQRAIKGVLSLNGGETVFATVTETQAMVYEEGRGYDIQELEYLAGGFTGDPGPYRQSRLNGLPFATSSFLAVKDTFYTVAALQYVQESVGGWQRYKNDVSTYIVLQATPTNTAGYPLHALGLLATALGVNIVTT